MGKLIDLTGKRFGRLVVLERAENKHRMIHWLCKCDCGNKKVVNGRNLKNGEAKSCGCLQKEMTKKSNIVHGLAHTRVYRTWNSMLRRCYDSRHTNYKHYGAKRHYSLSRMAR